MKISLEWLGDYLQPLPDAQAAADALTHGGLPVESIEAFGHDTVIDVEVTSNRSDCLSHSGIARELAALLGGTYRDVSISSPAGPETAVDGIDLEIAAPELCPYYSARVIRGVKIGPSPEWLSRRLEAVGVRSINNIVDITNYVMFEMGQPLHAFDLSRISGGKIVVRTALRGESLISIDGRKRDLTAGMLVIADQSLPIALAGVMGGVESEVSAATVDILLESARFDPLSIRKTARALAMKSDSSYRFERGIDHALPARASLRAVQLIGQIAGAKSISAPAYAGSDQAAIKKITLRLARLKQILGIDLPPQEVMDAFARLAFAPVLLADRIDVTVPGIRLDVNREIDLVEEAARVIGYDRIPVREEISIRLTPPDRESIIVDALCDCLVAAGYFEAVTFSFVSDALRNDFGASNLRADSSVRKADASLRPSLIPGLLDALAFNQTNGTAGAKLFEVGSIFSSGVGTHIDEKRAVGFVGGPDLREVRGVVESLLAGLDPDRTIRVEPDSHPGYGRGAGGRIFWGAEPVGFLGKIDRKITNKLSLREVPAAAELHLQPLLAGAKAVAQLKELPRFPGVRRDLSLIVKENLRYAEIQNLVTSLNLPMLEDVEFVTAYRGKPLEPGTKSVTITQVFRSSTTTLTSEQVEESVQRTIAAAREKLGASLRA